METKELSTIDKLKQMLSTDSIKNRLTDILRTNSAGYISSIISAVNNSEMLKKAEPQSIINSAVIAATLGLPINNNLGYAAIVPYNDKKSGKCVAQFQLMYKGIIELCQRSGQFKRIIDEVVYEGQLVSHNKFTGEYIFDENAKKSDKIIGYMAYFQLVNGFEKISYMTISEVEKHAINYSQSYRTGFGVWKDNFDVMARKTVLKLLLSKYAPKSIDLRRAVMFDQATVKGNLSDETDIDEAEVVYVDNEHNNSQKEVKSIDDITSKKPKNNLPGEELKLT